ncbi:MAG TPA: hypothetical protein VGM88_17890 [Kofleriaceae bacterium]
MLDWLGSVAIRKRSAGRVELELTRATAWTGWAMAIAGARLAIVGPVWAMLGGAFLVLVGVLFGTLKRSLVFDRDEGLLRSEQRILGVRRRAAVPLFHLRAVVVAARRGGMYVAYVERRVGGTIHLDEARQAMRLLHLAEAIAEVTGLRLVFDNTTRAAAVDNPLG